MSDAHKKISSPGYVRHTVAGLDDLFSRAATPVSEKSKPAVEPASPELKNDPGKPVPPEEVTITQELHQQSPQDEIIEAGDFLDFFYGEAQPACAISSSNERPPDADIETILDASSIIALHYENEPAVCTPPSPQTTSKPARATASVQAIVAKLEEVHTHLQSANFRIGYLESEITKSKQKLKLLPDLEAQASKASDIERENKELRNRLAVMEISARKLPSLERENQELQEQLEDLTYRKSNPWWKFWIHFTGSSARPLKRMEDKQYQRRHYY